MSLRFVLRPPWEGPTARHLRKAVVLMIRVSPLPIREGLQEFFRHCERLIGKALQPDHAPFSQDELQMMCYYANEIAKVVDSQRLHEQSNGKPSTR